MANFFCDECAKKVPDAEDLTLGAIGPMRCLGCGRTVDPLKDRGHFYADGAKKRMVQSMLASATDESVIKKAWLANCSHDPDGYYDLEDDLVDYMYILWKKGWLAAHEYTRLLEDVDSDDVDDACSEFRDGFHAACERLGQGKGGA